ncbi:MAG: hypothetical protein PHU56_02085 [Candidatus Pacebacteria bacterium]|nr:hypothetical protein [Candidatus Paceibacterota bacterium]
MEKIHYEARHLPKEDELATRLDVLNEYIRSLEQGNYVPGVPFDKLREEAKGWGPEDWKDFEDIRSGEIDPKKNKPFVEKMRMEKGDSAFYSLVEALHNFEPISGGY